MKKSMPFSVMAAAPSQRPEVSLLFRPKLAWVMGVLNATPDSFYTKSRALRIRSAVQLAGRMIAEGADVIDIGGESTKPGSASVPLKEEESRVLPVLRALRAKWPKALLSIDTQKSSLAKAALLLGADLINDISALRHDPDMADVVAEAKRPVVLMHMQGTPRDMQERPQYKNVVDEVKKFFEERIKFAVRRGIKEKNIILDPGIGFGKTLVHNLQLLKHTAKFAALGRPILIGVSRKYFIGRLLGGDASPLPVEDRLEGSLAAGLWAVKAGANGLRVHDVHETRMALKLWEGLASA